MLIKVHRPPADLSARSIVARAQRALAAHASLDEFAQQASTTLLAAFDQQRAAAAGARWTISYAARCDVTNFKDQPFLDGSALDLLRRRRREYLGLRW